MPDETPAPSEDPPAEDPPAKKAAKKTPPPTPAQQRAAAHSKAARGLPRPWRVESFAEGKRWGWRICARDGEVVSESGLDFDSEKGALESGAREDLAVGAVVPPRGRPLSAARAR